MSTADTTPEMEPGCSAAAAVEQWTAEEERAALPKLVEDLRREVARLRVEVDELRGAALSKTSTRVA